MIIEDNTYLDFQDVLLKPKRSKLASRSQVSLRSTIKTLHGYQFQGTPIIASNMLCGSFSMLKSLSPHEMFTAIAKHNNHLWPMLFDSVTEDVLPSIYTGIKYGFYTIGMSEDELQKLWDFFCLVKSKNENYDGIPLEEHIKVCIDIANGYTQKFSDFVHYVRERFPKNVIVAGNVATPDMCAELIIAGADGIKIGLGSSKFCRTRAATGVGIPQLSALIECADAVHGLSGFIISDGGCKTPGDIAKAFCANADMVMLGTMFSGTDECDGGILTQFEHDGTYRKQDRADGYYEFVPNVKEKYYKQFYGMSSITAQKKHGEYKPYRTSEGYEELVSYKGPVNDIILDILGGLRSTGTYIGANKIRHFGKCATFIRCNRTHSRN